MFPYESIHHIAIATKCRTTFQSQVLTIIKIEIATVNGEVNIYVIDLKKSPFMHPTRRQTFHHQTIAVHIK